MAADPTASERAYSEIKRKLLDGAFHLRQRLDATLLAEDLALSTTPVREALVRLAAERLIAARPPRGFYVSLWSESELRWLYLWRAQLADSAAAGLADAPPAREPIAGEDYPARIAAALGRLTHGANPELARVSANADERLHHARRAEAAIWADVAGEPPRLEAAIGQGRSRQLRTLLRAHFQRRLKAVKQIHERAVLGAMPRNGA